MSTPPAYAVISPSLTESPFPANSSGTGQFATITWTGNASGASRIIATTFQPKIIFIADITDNGTASAEGFFGMISPAGTETVGFDATAAATFGNLQYGSGVVFATASGVDIGNLGLKHGGNFNAYNVSAKNYIAIIMG